MPDNKYKMFSNYMHNELGITKEDIRIWIKEAVEEIALKMVQKEFDNFDVKMVVRKILFEGDGYFNSIRLKKEAREAVAEELCKRVDLIIKN